MAIVSAGRTPQRRKGSRTSPTPHGRFSVRSRPLQVVLLLWVLSFLTLGPQTSPAATFTYENTTSDALSDVATPCNPLTAFIGQQAQGTWTLFACDAFTGAAGTFNRAQLAFTGDPPQGCGAGEISGSVFRDSNADGLRGSAEIGLAGVVVTAYSSSGSAVASATSSATGTYALTGLSAATQYRLEFTNLPTGFAPGARGTDSPTTVQFVESSSCAAHVGLNRPELYCQSNPTLATNCYLNGNQSTLTGDVLVTFPFTAGNTGNSLPPGVDTPAPTHEAAANQIGPTWGLAYQRQSNSLFAAAFMKRHTSFGPGGTGAIYRIDRNSGTVSTFLNLNTLFGAGTAGTDPHPAGTDFSRDAASWAPVGKVGLGDLDISEDGQTLWTINLADRRLYRIPIGIPPVAPAAGSITRTALPLPADCVSSDVRPFATEFYEGKVYVGMVCSAESTQLATNLRGYVYSFDPALGTFTQVFNFPLNYPRGCAVVSGVSCTSAAWRPWSPIFTGVATPFIGEFVYPQPWLTDLEIDNGRMILGLRDRYGDQTGVQGLSTNLLDLALYSGDSAGDLLHACQVGGVWGLEANGSCNGWTTGGAGNTQGPGNGEFFFTENHPSHHEVSMGGMAWMPGHADAAFTVYDPIFDVNQAFDGGILWLSASAGTRTRGYRLYHTALLDPTFGKGGGLGDLEALCDLAPLELGNRVWNDSDGDGKQDPGENGIAGVSVQLACGGQTATVTTDANGNYLFTDTIFDVQTTYSRIPRLTACELRMDRSQAALTGFLGGATTANNGGVDVHADLRDSDGVSLGGTWVGVAFSTGTDGQNHHDWDFGFTNVLATGTVTGRLFQDTDGNGVQDPGEPGLSGVSVVITDSSGATQTVVTNANGDWTATVPGGTTTANVNEATLPAGFVQTAGTDPTTVTVLALSTTSAGIDGYQLNQTDNDNDGIPDQLEGTGDRDGDGIPNHQDYDPSGYLYDEVTGEIVSGGQVSVSGPGAVNLIADGSSGAYRYSTDGTPGVYTVDVTAPFGYQPSTACLPLDPPAYAATLGPNPTVLGNGENRATGFLTSNACTPYYRTFALTAGDPFIINNNLALEPVPVCYAIADSDKLSDSDQLIAVDTASGASVPIGPLGTLDVESAAFGLDGATLYAVNGGQLGVVNLTTGTFTALPNPIGSGDGSAGTVLLSDIDSLTFDPLTGILYGVHRTVGANTPDLLFIINPLSGALVTDTFGVGIDYVAIPVILGLESIDDIAIDPADGQLYGIANDDATGHGDRLVKIDKVTGAISDVGPFGVIDVEGLSFHNDGTLFASTGQNSLFTQRDRLYLVNKSTGAATLIAPLFAGFTDYESLACMTEAPNTMSGTVFVDDDGDGTHDQPPEAGQPGVTVHLYLDVNDDGLVDAGDVLIQTTVTDANGDYHFLVATDGHFVLEIDTATLPPGSTLTTDNVEEADFVGLGNSDPDNDFGFQQGATLGDFIWGDLDADGIQDVGEVGIAGVSVELLDGLGNVLATTTTDANGLYAFTYVTPGSYAIRVTPPAGYVFSPQDQGGDNTLDSDVHPATGKTATVTLVAGQIYNDLDAGLYQPAALGDYFWDDLDADGIQEVGEPGIAGATVQLLNALGNVLATTTTDANGFYAFSGLVPGNYAVRFTLPAGFAFFSPQDQGGNDALDSDANPSTGQTALVSLAPGEVDNTVDAGAYQNASLGDYVWLDADGDGLQDGSEVGIAGVTVELLDAFGAVLATTTTAADGSYLFDQLAPGTYAVHVLAPAGLSFTAQDQGMNDAIDSDVDPGTGQTIATTLVSGESDLTWDAGLFAPASLGNFVWEDVDGDGIQDAGEPGLGGVSVELLASDLSPVAITTTAADGSYSFTGIAPGDYVVAFTPPVGFSISPQDQGGDDTLDSDPDPIIGLTGIISLTSGETDDTVDAGMIAPPTEALVTSVAAYADGGSTVIAFTTNSELGTAGFFVERFDEKSQRYVPLHDGLLTGLAHAPAGGTYYLKVDRERLPLANQYELRIIELETGGRMVDQGGFAVKVTGSSPVAVDHELRVPHPLSATDQARLASRRAEYDRAVQTRDQSTGNAVKILVEQAGFYRLSAAELAARFGVTTATIEQRIARNGLVLSHAGAPVAWTADTNNQGLLFYAEAIDNPYTDTNVYWLYQGRGRRIEFTAAGQPTAVSDQTFRQVLVAEENRQAAPQLANQPEADFWYWEIIRPGLPNLDTRSFTFDVRGKATSAADAVLTVFLQGASASGLAQDHRAIISLNNQQLGQVDWRGLEPHTATFSFPQAWLREGPNTVKVRGVLAAGVPFSLFYVDRFELSYDQLYRTSGPAFTFSANGHRTITVSGWSDSNVRVFDITQPQQPKEVSRPVISGSSGNFQVSFAPASATARYLAVSPAGLRSARNLWAAGNSDLHAATHSANYLLIAPAELLAAARTLADHRQRQGWDTEVVNLEHIYDEFSAGLVSPLAIRDFLAYAAKNWQGQPTHAVLLGAGDYDYHDNLGYSANLVPPMLTRTSAGLLATDAPFTDFDDDWVPDIALGRLPVLDSAELSAYLQKVLQTEAAAAEPQVLLIADRSDVAGDFSHDIAAVAQLLPSRVSQARIDLSAQPLTAARQQLFQALNQGVPWIEYLGHASLDRISDLGLLKTSDLSTLNATGALPIITAKTCVLNRFGIPGFQSLGEALITEPDSGGLAVWSAAGLSQNRQAKILAQSLMSEVYRSDDTLGDLIRRALRQLAAQGGTEEMLMIYNLLGEPVLQPNSNR